MIDNKLHRLEFFEEKNSIDDKKVKRKLFCEMVARKTFNEEVESRCVSLLPPAEVRIVD